LGKVTRIVTKYMRRVLSRPPRPPSVRRGLHRVLGQGLVYEEPKADHSRRTGALPAQLVEALREYRAAPLEERARAGELWRDHDLVFAQPNGKPIERRSDWRAWKRLLDEAGVREVRLHDGRHTAATLLLSEGVHPRVVMEVPGHSQMRTTTDMYSNVMPALGKDAAERA
jgi:integrase